MSNLKLQTGIIFLEEGLKCAYLALMSSCIATPLGRDFNKIVLFSAQFLRVKIGRDFARMGLRRSSSRTCRPTQSENWKF